MDTHLNLADAFIEVTLEMRNKWITKNCCHLLGIFLGPKLLELVL